MKLLRQLFAKEHYLGFDQASTTRLLAMRDLFVFNGLLHKLIRIGSMAFNAALLGKAAMGINNLTPWYAGLAL
jgi:hypothetical protein